MSAVVIMAGLAGVLGAVALTALQGAWRARQPRAGTNARAVGRARRALTALGRRAAPRAPGDLRSRLDAAGVATPPGDVMALKAGSLAATAAVAGLTAPWLPGRLGWLVAIVLPALAFMAPDAWLRRRRLRRGQAMERELADVLELLRVALEAGLSIRRALAEVGRRHPGLLAAELGGAAARLELGVPHAAAVSALERRCPVEGMAAFTAALRRAERHGSPLGDALAAQAEQARARRARVAAEGAARAAPKIQLVVALLLVPSAMLLVAAAMIPALSWR